MIKGRLTKEKEILEYLIKNNGSCYNKLIDCGYCLAGKAVPACSRDDEPEIYRQAISIYVEKYGKENLVEMLI